MQNHYAGGAPGAQEAGYANSGAAPQGAWNQGANGGGKYPPPAGAPPQPGGFIQVSLSPFDIRFVDQF